MTKTQAKAMLFLAIVGAAAGLFLLVKGDSRPGYRVLSVPESREVLRGLFREADSFEVYTDLWPGKERTSHHLALVRRSDATKRWATWIRDLDGAREVRPLQLGPTIKLRFLRNGKSLGEVESAPEQTKMVIRLPHDTRAQLEFPSSLQAFLLGFEERRREALRRAAKEQEETSPVVTARNPFFLPGPPAKSAEETRTRLLKLFQEGSYVNFTGPFGAGAVDIRTDGRREWERMTRAVEKALPGGAIPGPAETRIAVEHPDRPSMMITLDYDGGLLGAEDPYYGGNVYTITPGKDFESALLGLSRRGKGTRGG